MNRFRVPSVPTYTDFEGLSRTARSPCSPTAPAGIRRLQRVRSRRVLGRPLGPDDRAGGEASGRRGGRGHGGTLVRHGSGLTALRGERPERVPAAEWLPRSGRFMVAARGGGLWLVSGKQVYRYGRYCGATRVRREQFGEPHWVSRTRPAACGSEPSARWCSTQRAAPGPCGRAGWARGSRRSSRPATGRLARLDGSAWSAWRGRRDGLHAASGLPDDQVQQIVEDADGRIGSGARAGSLGEPNDFVIRDGASAVVGCASSTRATAAQQHRQARAQPAAARSSDRRLSFTTSRASPWSTRGGSRQRLTRPP